MEYFFLLEEVEEINFNLFLNGLILSLIHNFQTENH